MIRKSGIKGEGKIPKVLKITRFCDLIDDTFVLWKKRNLTGKKVIKDIDLQGCIIIQFSSELVCMCVPVVAICRFFLTVTK